MIKAIALDFDGVILESADIKTEAFRELFRPRCPDALEAIVAIHVRHAGVSRYRKFEMIFRDILHRPLGESESRQLGEEFSRLVFQEVLRAPFVTGAEPFLRRFSERLPLFVVSGTPGDELEQVVSVRGLSRYFRRVYGSPATKIELLERIRQEVGIRDGSLLCVGDGLSDWESARACGATFVGRVPMGKPNPFAGLADIFCVSDLRDLMERWVEISGEREATAAPGY